MKFRNFELFFIVVVFIFCKHYSICLIFSSLCSTVNVIYSIYLQHHLFNFFLFYDINLSLLSSISHSQWWHFRFSLEPYFWHSLFFQIFWVEFWILIGSRYFLLELFDCFWRMNCQYPPRRHHFYFYCFYYLFIDGLLFCYSRNSFLLLQKT